MKKAQHGWADLFSVQPGKEIFDWSRAGIRKKKSDKKQIKKKGKK